MKSLDFSIKYPTIMIAQNQLTNVNQVEFESQNDRKIKVNEQKETEYTRLEIIFSGIRARLG